MCCNGHYFIGEDVSKEIIHDENGEVKMIITTYSGPLKKVYFPCKESNKCEPQKKD